MTVPLDPRHDARFQRGDHQPTSLGPLEAPDPIPERGPVRTPPGPPAMDTVDLPFQAPSDGRVVIRRGAMVVGGLCLVLLGLGIHFGGWVLAYVEVDTGATGYSVSSATTELGWRFVSLAPMFVTAGCVAFILVPLLRALRIASAVRVRSGEQQGRPRADEQGRTERQAGSAT